MEKATTGIWQQMSILYHTTEYLNKMHDNIFIKAQKVVRKKYFRISPLYLEYKVVPVNDIVLKAAEWSIPQALIRLSQ